MAASVPTIGVVGTGFGSYVHVPALRLAGWDVVGITSRSQEKTHTATTTHGIAVFDSWQELLRVPGLTALSVASPQSTHKEIVSAAIAAGKHVLCEKPFCLNTSDAHALLVSAEEALRVHAINFEFRDHPALTYIKHWMRQKKGGRIRSVAVSWKMSGWANPERLWAWQCDATQGGGILSSIGVHTFDYLEWFLEEPIIRLKADMHVTFPSRRDATGMEKPVTAPDVASLQLVFQSGATGTVALASTETRDTGHGIHIQGEEGEVRLHSGESKDYAKGFSVQEKQGEVWKDIALDLATIEHCDDGRVGMMVPLAARFLRSVQGIRDPELPSFKEGMRTTALAEAAYASQKEGGWVDTPVRDTL